MSPISLDHHPGVTPGSHHLSGATLLSTAPESEIVMSDGKHAADSEASVIIDEDGFEVRDGLRTGDRSPDGAPAFPEITGSDTQWLIAASFGAVVLLSLAMLAVFGFWVSLVALVLGTGLAVVANPSIWATAARSRERASVHHR